VDRLAYGRPPEFRAVGNDIQLISSRTGFSWAISGAGRGPGGLATLYRTTNGGRNWQSARFRLDLAAGFQATVALAFTDATHGWLVAAGATWHTIDGGRTWTRACALPRVRCALRVR
jgi:photosystem II stability/assembly factor-like uncharacterized protein